MQASAVTTDALAERLLLVWKELTSLAGGEVVDVLDELELSLAQLKILEVVSAAGERPSVKALSEQIGCSLANSSRAADALVRRGLVERREDEHDRRVKRLGLTAEGAAALERIDAVRLAALERFAARLEPDQHARLLGALEDITAPPAPSPS
jgi:DNA-binding MarR family transcriptional regulator